MERLTTRNSMGVAVYKQPYECDKCDETIWRLPDYGSGSPTDRLAKYEELEEQCIKETTWGFKELLYKWKVFLDDMADLVKYRQLEKQGLLLRLPCKVGDTVYSVVKDGLSIIPLKFSLNFYVRRNSDFGKTVFLTKEEAEQALAEMKGE